MSDTIHYNYGANNASLEDIQGRTNDAQALREEVAKVFNALNGVYDGQAAATLQQKQIEISQMLDNVLMEITQTRSGGNQSQEDARALDAHLAGGF
nr:hypothetical protein [Mycolicibacterium komanii]CRL74525.1 hypothetical protein CPGR_03705 [Mycolicibacterium komanii]